MISCFSYNVPALLDGCLLLIKHLAHKFVVYAGGWISVDIYWISLTGPVWYGSVVLKPLPTPRIVDVATSRLVHCWVLNDINSDNPFLVRRSMPLSIRVIFVRHRSAYGATCNNQNTYDYADYYTEFHVVLVVVVVVVAFSHCKWKPEIFMLLSEQSTDAQTVYLYQCNWAH